MREVVFVGGVRTPIGRYGGNLKDVPPEQLLTLVLQELIKRTNVDPAVVDDVIMGQCYQNAEATNIARLAWLMADFPEEVPGFTLDRRCSSGLNAIIEGALAIGGGFVDVVVAGGVESMSTVEYYVPGMPVRWGTRRGHLTLYDRLARGRTTMHPEKRYGPLASNVEWADNMGRKYNIPREEADRWALRSHQRAVAAMESCKFSEEIVPVTVPQSRGEPRVVSEDEGPRADTSLEALAKLRPVLGGISTAGNSSTENDAAAAVLMMSAEKARELGVKPWASFISYGVAGTDPRYTGDGIPPAVRKALKHAGLTWKDLDLVEINEAFCTQILSNFRVLEIEDTENINVNGSGISLGHPVGCTGARIMVTLLNEMRRRGSRYGLETMCVGGGMGYACVLEQR